MVTNFIIICQKTQDKGTIASLMRALKMRIIMGILNSNKKKNSGPPRKSAFIVGGSMIKEIDGYLLTSSVNHKYIVKVRLFVTAKTDDTYDHIKPRQIIFQPNVYISHVGTNDLPTAWHQKRYPKKLLLFLNI